MKTILIVGANSGVGKGIVQKLSNLDYQLILTGTKFIETENHSSYILNLKDDENIKSFVNQLDKIDGVVLTAGIIEQIPLKFISREALYNLFDINFFGPLLVLKELSKQKKLNQGASIVAISSIAGNKFGSIGNTIYASTKAAFDGAIKCLALELTKQKVRINSIQPGMLDTEMWKAENTTIDSETLNKDALRYPLGYGKPKDVANLVAFLLSEESTYINGSAIVLDGGFSVAY